MSEKFVQTLGFFKRNYKGFDWKNGKVVLLTAKPETILERVKDDHSRPLLEGNKTVDYIAELMEKRREKYETAADIVVATDGRSAEEICGEIIGKLQV